MAIAQIRNRATARLADDIIGAAQALEAEAQRLKARARIIRVHGLLALEAVNPIVNQREHKAADIRRAAEAAILALSGPT